MDWEEYDVINPELGSWLLLGAIICGLPLSPIHRPWTAAACTLCLSLSTGVSPGHDSTRPGACHVSIEYRGVIRRRIAGTNHLFSCDVCGGMSWNAAPLHLGRLVVAGRSQLDQLIDLWRSTDSGCSDWRHGVTRAGVRGLRRNLAVALETQAMSGSRGAERIAQSIRPAIRSSSHAQWAKRKLSA
jgi:epoxyqueuosine reductase QueG